MTKTVEVPLSLEVALEARDLSSPGKLIRDGEWHSLDAEGKGRYKIPLDDPFIVFFQNFRDGLPCEHWKGNGHARKMLPQELAAAQAECERARSARAVQAAQAVRKIWEHAEVATPDHPYLKAKGIPPHHLRVKSMNPHKGALLVPLFDPAGELVNLQYITRDAKRFHPGAECSGTFTTFGQWPPKPKDDIVIVEGAATAASVHESTGHTVVAAMSAGNLLAVGKALRKKFPGARFTFFADNDASGRGLADAVEAAETVGGLICMASKEGDDANDLHRREGPDAVAAVLASAKEAGEWQALRDEGWDPSPAAAEASEDGTRSAHSSATSTARRMAPLFEPFEVLLEKCPPLNWLVEGLVETPSSVLFFGPSGAGKSFVAGDLAGACTTGGTWYGDRKVTPGRVLYIAGEGHRGLLRRFQAWELARGTKIPPGKLFLSTRRLELDADCAAAVEAEIEQMGAAPALVIVDTIARAMPAGTDENSARDMGEFVNVMDGIRDRFGCVVVLVHHTGQADQSRARGSSALKAAMDAEMSVSRNGGGFKVEWTKLKDLPEEPEPMAFVLESYDVGPDEGTEPTTSAAVIWRGAVSVRLGVTEAIGLRTLHAQGSGPVAVETWRCAFIAAHPGAASSAKRTAWGRARESLQARNLVHLNGEYVTLTEAGLRFCSGFGGSASAPQSASKVKLRRVGAKRLKRLTPLKG